MGEIFAIVMFNSPEAGGRKTGPPTSPTSYRAPVRRENEQTFYTCQFAWHTIRGEGLLRTAKLQFISSEFGASLKTGDVLIISENGHNVTGTVIILARQPETT